MFHAGPGRQNRVFVITCYMHIAQYRIIFKRIQKILFFQVSNLSLLITVAWNRGRQIPRPDRKKLSDTLYCISLKQYLRRQRMNDMSQYPRYVLVISPILPLIVTGSIPTCTWYILALADSIRFARNYEPNCTQTINHLNPLLLLDGRLIIIITV